MATLLLTDTETDYPDDSHISLRAWLAEGWALLFSHPDDFAVGDLEYDRWLTILHRTFADRQVRPLALAKPGQPADAGWVTQVTGDTRLVTLNEPCAHTADIIELRSRQLHDQINDSGPRFVMLIDAMLACRRTYVYERPGNLPSPMDFLSWVDRLSDRTVRVTVRPQSVPIRETDRPKIHRPREITLAS